MFVCVFLWFASYLLILCVLTKWRFPKIVLEHFDSVLNHIIYTWLYISYNERENDFIDYAWDLKSDRAYFDNELHDLALY